MDFEKQVKNCYGKKVHHFPRAINYLLKVNHSVILLAFTVFKRTCAKNVFIVINLVL